MEELLLRTGLPSFAVAPAFVLTRLLPPVAFGNELVLEPFGIRFTTLSCKRTNDSAPYGLAALVL